MKLHNAIRYAIEKHENQTRKGSKIPYIVHPLETMQILAANTTDQNILIAGVLHDTIEDQNVSFDELKEIFGEDVACLVNAVSEDKSIEDWKERKILAIEDIKKSNKRVKLIVCADKLSNLKSIYYDVLKEGEQMFCKFNAGNRENVAWYYKSMIDACSEISSYECYKNLVELYNKVFPKIN